MFLHRYFPNMRSEMIPILNTAAARLPFISIGVNTNEETWTWYIKQEDRTPIIGEPFEISNAVRKKYKLSSTSFRDFIEAELAECDDDKGRAVNKVAEDLAEICQACRAVENKNSHHHFFNAMQVAVFETYLDGDVSSPLYRSTGKQCLVELNKVGDRLLRTVVASLDDDNPQKATFLQMFDNADRELHTLFCYVQEQEYQKEKIAAAAAGPQ